MESSLNKIWNAGFEAYSSGLFHKAVQIFAQGVEQARKQNDERWEVKFLFCQGECLMNLNQTEEAVTVLMQAANHSSPNANPADVYNSLTKLIELSLINRNYPEIQQLIDQTQLWLKQQNREHWQHRLQFLKGMLEYQRGNFQGAYDHVLEGWNHQTDTYPSYTDSTFLNLLCNSSYYLKDLTKLSHWVNCFKTTRNPTTNCYISEKRAKLLETLLNQTCSTQVELARDTLEQVNQTDNPNFFERVAALRVLMLAKQWVLLEHWLEILKPDEDGFDDVLFLGDERLTRARDALGLQLRNDEIDEDTPIPAHIPGNLHQGQQFLTEARARYEKTIPLAAKEDKRLQTEFYTTTLNARLERVAALEAACQRQENHDS